MKYEEKHTFYAYLNPICAAIGIMGLLLYMEIDYFEIGITGLCSWGTYKFIAYGSKLLE